MENQENTMVVKPQSPLSLTGVLREAFKTTRRNGKLVLSILLIVFLSSSQLELGSSLALTPILKNFVSHFQTTSGYEYQKPRSFENPRPSQWVDQNKYTHNRDVSHTGMVQHVHSSPGIIRDSLNYMGEPLSKGQIKDLRDFLGVELLILVVSCVISLFFLVSAISSSYEAHTTKVMSLKDVFLKFKESWKRPIHTSFCLALISLGLFTLFAIFTGVIPLIAQGSCVFLLYGILIITAFFTYFHMAVRWILSLVVSVLETKSSGLKAIDRAGELTEGKKIQALVLMLLFHFAMGAVHQISGALTKQCNLAICLMYTQRMTEAKFLLQTVRSSNGNGQMYDSYAKSFERAVEVMNELESENKANKDIQTPFSVLERNLADKYKKETASQFPRAVFGNNVTRGSYRGRPYERRTEFYCIPTEEECFAKDLLTQPRMSLKSFTSGDQKREDAVGACNKKLLFEQQSTGTVESIEKTQDVSKIKSKKSWADMVEEDEQELFNDENMNCNTIQETPIRSEWSENLNEKIASLNMTDGYYTQPGKPVSFSKGVKRSLRFNGIPCSSPLKKKALEFGSLKSALVNEKECVSGSSVKSTRFC